jgi:hypothetical protein
VALRYENSSSRFRRSDVHTVHNDRLGKGTGDFWAGREEFCRTGLNIIDEEKGILKLIPVTAKNGGWNWADSLAPYAIEVGSGESWWPIGGKTVELLETLEGKGKWRGRVRRIVGYIVD